MYQNFRVALELTGKRFQHTRAIENNRHRRTINEPPTTSMPQVEEESIDDTELIHEQSINADEKIDLNTNFNISQTEYSPTEFHIDLSAHCNSSISTDDELLIFDDILQSNGSNNVQPLHCHTNISTTKCCRQLAKIFLDSNTSLFCFNSTLFRFVSIQHYLGTFVSIQHYLGLFQLNII
ncbi:unnamed protein product [Rotaria magnacalcarata]